MKTRAVTISFGCVVTMTMLLIILVGCEMRKDKAPPLGGEQVELGTIAEAGNSAPAHDNPFREMAERFKGVDDRLETITCQYLANETEGVVLSRANNREYIAYKISNLGKDTNHSRDGTKLVCGSRAWTSYEWYSGNQNQGGGSGTSTFFMVYERDADGDWWYRTPAGQWPQ